MEAPEDLDAYLARRREMVNDALERLVPAEACDPAVLSRAVRYSVFAGGKRIRPILCLAAGEAVAGPGVVHRLLSVACALECIHTYSLIHDDLPAMDDDDYRRGRPTSHRVFGEAMAILAGDALLTLAFEILADAGLSGDWPPERILAVIREIAQAAGVAGMVGGQVADVEAEGKTVDMDGLRRIHARKTGALLVTSVRSGALLAGSGERDLDALTAYGRRMGMAFQIADDILNVSGNRDLMGKGTGSDAVRGKATFPGLVGLPAARKALEECTVLALDEIRCLDGRADPLRNLAIYLAQREG